MTGRELIRKITESCIDLDGEISVNILYRDADNCGQTEDWTDKFSFINGKIQVEAARLISRRY